MKKIGLICAIVIFMLACSVSDLLPTPTALPLSASPNIEENLEPSQALFLIHPTPSFTQTPTLIGLLSDTQTPVIFTEAKPSTPSPTPVRLSSDSLFESVSLSGSQIFWGVCEPGAVKVTARVTDPEKVYNVVIFVHLEDTTSDNSTPWSTGDAMNNDGKGKFTYSLNADVIDEHRHYLNAWVIYQLVATDKPGNTLARTQIFLRTLTIAPCA